MNKILISLVIAMITYSPFSYGDNMLNNGGIFNRNSSGGGGVSGITSLNGNIGINSTAPGTRLDVQGTVRATNFIGSGAGLTGITAGAAGGLNAVQYNSPLGTTAGTEARFSFNGTNVGVGTTNAVIAPLEVWGNIYTNGNVGINSTLPGSVLDVNGTARFISGNVGIGTDSTPDATLEITRTGTTDPFIVSSTTTATGDYLDINTGGNIGISSSAPGQKLDVQGTVRNIGTIVNGNVGIGTSFTNNGTFALSVMNGNVGVGTTIPAYSLNIIGGNIGIGTAVSLNHLIDAVSTINTNATIGIFAPNGTTTPVAIYMEADPNVGIANFNSRQNFPFGIKINNTEQMRIDTSGNLGLGTTAPITLLDINRKLNVSSGGNVGVGTWVSQNTLTVKGAISAGFTANTLATNSIGASGGLIAGSTFLTPAAGGIISTGNVSIGTSATDQALQIYSSALTTFKVNSSIAQSSASGSVFALYEDPGAAITSGNRIGTWLIGGSSDNAHTIVNSGALEGFTDGDWSGSSTPTFIKISLSPAGATARTERMRITSAGNVGLSSATPGQRLDVQGTIRISLIGATLGVVSGTNGCHGTATLSSGTATVSTTCTPASAQNIFLTDSGGGVLANIGALSVGTVTGGTSFVINSANALDSSNVGWIIIN